MNKTDPQAAREGADVIRKLLERDGLGDEAAAKYFDMMIQRYNTAEDSTLRAAVLNSMSLLCVQSVYKAQACKSFGVLFEKALQDGNAGVREAAANGLVYIDGPRALGIFRQSLTGEGNEAINKKMIELASNVGAAEDLVWLAEKVNTPPGKGAWDAMLTIFRRCDAAVVTDWIDKLSQGGGNPVKVTDEQLLVFLEIAERKIDGKDNTGTVKKIRRIAADIYRRTGNHELAVKNLGFLLAGADEKDGILSEMFDSYVKLGNIKAASDLVHNYLLEKDLGQDSVLCKAIETNVNVPNEQSQKMLASLLEIKVENRPQWAGFLAKWQSKPVAADVNVPPAAQQ